MPERRTVIEAEIRGLRDRAIALAASLDQPARAKRRTRNLLLSAAGIAGGLILAPVTGFGSFAIMVASGYVLTDNLVEDNEVYVQDLKAQFELQQLNREIEELERASQNPNM